MGRGHQQPQALRRPRGQARPGGRLHRPGENGQARLPALQGARGPLHPRVGLRGVRNPRRCYPPGGPGTGPERHDWQHSGAGRRNPPLSARLHDVLPYVPAGTGLPGLPGNAHGLHAPGGSGGGGWRAGGLRLGGARQLQGPGLGANQRPTLRLPPAQQQVLPHQLGQPGHHRQGHAEPPEVSGLGPAGDGHCPYDQRAGGRLHRHPYPGRGLQAPEVCGGH
ncbi:hypothetical protein HRbin23_01495 [bacterium HR23]|nr:hypothetical protein HRbin23_01495 [bacterium HR23]